MPPLLFAYHQLESTYNSSKCDTLTPFTATMVKTIVCQYIAHMALRSRSYIWQHQCKMGNLFCIYFTCNSCSHISSNNMFMVIHTTH